MKARPWLAAALVTAALLVAIGGIAAERSSSHGAVATVASTAPVTSTTEHRVSTTTPPTSTTRPASPEGATRAGTGSDVVAGATTASDGVDRSTTTEALLGTLATIAVRPEASRTGYDRSLFKHWDDEDHDGCDTRCEVLASQRRADGSWLSEWDGYVTSDPSELQIDHVVALAEAWDSGADTWTAAQREQFANDPTNLLAVSASANERKGDRDAAEWFPSRADADCLWSSTVVRVKAHWGLSVDQAEHDALVNLLHTCADFVASTATTAPAVTLPAPPPPTVASEPSGDCTPGYDPCIPPGPDVDCAGGRGDGPRYVQGPVTVTGSDPYNLDGNHDGIACA